MPCHLAKPQSFCTILELNPCRPRRLDLTQLLSHRSILMGRKNRFMSGYNKLEPIFSVLDWSSRFLRSQEIHQILDCKYLINTYYWIGHRLVLKYFLLICSFSNQAVHQPQKKIFELNVEAHPATAGLWHRFSSATILAAHTHTLASLASVKRQVFSIGDRLKKVMQKA